MDNNIAVLKALNEGAYESSFAYLTDGTTYKSNHQDIDMTPELRDIHRVTLKALSTTTGGSGSTDQVLVPIWVDPRIVDISRKYVPYVEAIPRVTNLGRTADWNQITAKGAAASAAELATLVDQTDTYVRKSELIKFLYSKGKVSGPAQAAIPPYIADAYQSAGAGLEGSAFSSVSAPNAKQLDVIQKARALRELEENLIFNGDDGVTATDFNGIIKQQGTTNVRDLAGAAIVFDDIEENIKQAFDASGRPALAAVPSGVAAELRKIVINTFNYRPQDMTVELPFGVSSHLVLDTVIGPIPVVPTQFLSNTTGDRRMYFLDMDFIEMRVLQDMTFIDLPREDDAEVFLLRIYESLVLRAPEFNSFIDNIE